ncbi:MAG: sulfite exporter TauE/SafE family protein [Spirochaetales bacterium]|nr:sulfite exporter TauE/SafE family protein [Spirochaetales bacterium]
MKILWVEAFILGLSTGPLCIASCAPVLVPFFASADRMKVKTDIMRMGLFMAGRLLGYLVTGLAAGLVGQAISPLFNSKTESVMSIVMGILLFLFGIIRNFPGIKFCEFFQRNRMTSSFVIIFGIVTGLSICPPFIAAFASSSAAGGIGLSILYFLFFFFGTSIFIFPLFLAGFISRVEELKGGARVCLFLTGIWFCVKGFLVAGTNF